MTSFFFSIFVAFSRNISAYKQTVVDPSHLPWYRFSIEMLIVVVTYCVTIILGKNQDNSAKCVF